MTDLHCHILPCVDDGAGNTEESLELLKLEAEQGVSHVCLTPHLRHGMFTTPDRDISEAFERLKKNAKDAQIPVELYLSREYYFSDEFLELLERDEIIPIGKNTVLVEFSYSSPIEDLLSAARIIIEKNYTPLFAHVERYKVIQKNPEYLKELIEMGVKIQINASSVTGDDGLMTQLLCKKMIGNEWVHVIASDAHDPEHRTVNLQKCRFYLSKKYGYQLSRKLMIENPFSILQH